jgi:hypothetical protein
MATRRPGTRAFRFRPAADRLEDRKLLSAVVSGTDIDGDVWTLRLSGPGDLRVLNQPDAAGNAVPAGQPASIQSIETAGTTPLVSRLSGTVQKAAAGDGKVFFENMTVLGSRGASPDAIYGIHVIDIPDFWLGHTATTTPVGGQAGSIQIAQGTNTLRFGGVDATYTPPGGTPLNQNNQNDTFSIALGLPKTIGTSVVVDKLVSSAQAATTTGGRPTQDAIVFDVAGRINLFQANAVEGDPNFPSTGFQGGGGTVVRSLQDADITVVTGGGVIGQIGHFKVLNNATNLGVESFSLISNLTFGGETENVTVLAPEGIRNANFGRGFDTTTIYARELHTLFANRGAIGSSITVNDKIGQMRFGGDVVDTVVQAGYQQDLLTALRAQQPPQNEGAQAGGAIQSVLIGGNVINSVFAASVVPLDGVFGTSQDLKLPHGVINAKVEGTITNDTATPDSPQTAFYAKTVKLATAPVIPPSVPEAPYPNADRKPTWPRLAKVLQPASPELRQRLAVTRPATRVSTPLRLAAGATAIDPTAIVE